MHKAIFTFVEKCVACKGCEVACAVEHSSSKTLVGALADTPRPRPHVRVQAAGAYSYPARCQHCQDAACIAACPMGAMTRNGDTGAVFVNKDRCVGCWMCVMVCPFGGVSADPVARKAHKCDRCPERTAAGLDPACVAACPTKAMIFATPEEIAELRRLATAQAATGMPTTTAAPTIAAWRAFKGGAHA